MGLLSLSRILHRDVIRQHPAPDPAYSGGRERVLLTDFGISKALDETGT
jgi:hypothetical protein